MHYGSSPVRNGPSSADSVESTRCIHARQRSRVHGQDSDGHGLGLQEERASFDQPVPRPGGSVALPLFRSDNVRGDA